MNSNQLSVTNEPKLSKRDHLTLALFALTTIDRRIGRRENRINFTSAMLESEHSGYLDYVGESMFSWSEEELKEFALKEVNQL